MADQEMKVGVWFYGVGTVLTGLLNIAWAAFDASHQPVILQGKDFPGQAVLAYIAGGWLVAAGISILWRRSVRIGSAACAIIYSIFAAFWVTRYYSGVHTLGWRIDVLLGISFGLGQQLMLIPPAAIVYVRNFSPDPLFQKRVAIASRWMLGLPPIFFGLLHLVGIRVFATIVPHWMGFGYFWAALTGIAFILAGGAICSGIMDILALRLLALMLLLFEGLVEIPPIFIRLHNEGTWGAAVYNVTAVGACLIFATFLASRTERKEVFHAKNTVVSNSDPAVA